MSPPPGWQNPIFAAAGQVQRNVEARLLLPSRRDLLKVRLAYQRALIQSGQRRMSPIQVTLGGVIFDGHHAVRVAAEQGGNIDVLVIDQEVPPAGSYILDLPVR